MNLLPRSSWRLGLRSQEYFRQPPRARLSLELLEGRLVPSTFFVVPALSANGLNSFATLQQALGPAKAGDTIQIEPGSQPGDATVTLNNLTIKADPQFGNTALQNSGTEYYICGLEQFMLEMSDYLKAQGVGAARVKFELFSTGDLAFKHPWTAKGEAEKK